MLTHIARGTINYPLQCGLKDCTFISSTSLYRLFTKKYGMTPQRFLRNARLC